LRDYLRAGWGDAVVSSSTTEHPLQPFSRRYFEADSALFTYAREWRAMHQQTGADGSEGEHGLTGHALSPFVPNPAVPLTLQQLTQFLRKPVKAFFRQRLLVAFGDDTPAQWDDELFSVGGLDAYQLVQTLLEGASAAPSAESATAQAQAALARLRQSGALPLQALGDLAQQQLQDTLAAMLHAWHEQQAHFAHSAPRQSLRLQAGEVLLEDWVDGLRQAVPSDAGDEMQTSWLQLEPGNLCAKTTKPKPRPEQLLGAWLRSLASAASGVQASGVVVGRDSVLEITPMDPALARTTLQRLVQLWQSGMQAPLPLPPKTALAWLAHAKLPEPKLAKAQQAARTQYEGDQGSDYVRGDVEEACMARVFPDFEALQSDGQFAALALAIYQPLLDWQKTHVRATLHAKQHADAGASDEDDNGGTP
jgi:exodeoxyribonuclease V gamma subunit